MPVTDALNFFNRFREDPALRNEINSLDSSEAVGIFIQNKGYAFTDDEFVNMIRSQTLHARDEYAASEIREIGMWYKMLRGLI